MCFIVRRGREEGGGGGHRHNRSPNIEGAENYAMITETQLRPPTQPALALSRLSVIIKITIIQSTIDEKKKKHTLTLMFW